MSKIIAIGGGEIRKKNTLKIDKEIIKFSGKKKPKLLFLPTASSDAVGYFEKIKEYFGKLGCRSDVLYLIKNPPSKKEIENKILGSDIIYVGGGNTLKMMTAWKKLGVNKILEKALKKDIVLCGLSAGSICWFNYGSSDSRKFTSGSKKLIKVTGLGFINALNCPHYDSEPQRQTSLKKMMRKNSLVAIVLEDCCAFQIQNDTYKILTSKKGAKAYKIYWKKNKYFKEEIKQKNNFLSLKDLIKK